MADIANIQVPLGEDYPEIRADIRAICASFPGAYWRKLEDAGAYPEEFVNALTESKYLGALIPKEYGGLGLSIRAGGVILEEIHASGCNAGACHAQMYLMGTVLRHGSVEQKKRYLPDIAAGRVRLQVFGISERNTGSDTTKLTTTARRDGDRYLINGEKYWMSRAFASDMMLLLARTTPVEQCKRRSDGLSVFLFNLHEARAQGGLDITKVECMINHQTSEMTFDNVSIPASSLVGEEGKGFKYILDSMNAERCLVASECVGDGRFFVRKAADYSKERQVFGRPIGANQAVQFPIARAHAEVRAADLMARAAAALFDAGQPCGEEANTAKMLASEAAWNAAEACMQTHGGFGFAREHDVERKWREARVLRIGPISTNLILSYIGEHVLGMPRSY